MASNSKLIQSKWTVRGRLISWSCCLDERCRGRGWLGAEACVALLQPEALRLEFLFLFFRAGPEQWEHQLFRGWQVRRHMGTRGWRPLSSRWTYREKPIWGKSWWNWWGNITLRAGRFLNSAWLGELLQKYPQRPTYLHYFGSYVMYYFFVLHE